MDVFLVQHVHVQEDEAEDLKMIGIYSSQAAADAAVQRLRQQPGFRDTPEGFSIDRYQVDEDHWSEGFVTVRS